MADLILKNIDPVVLSTRIDEAGQLVITHGQTTLDGVGDAVVVGVASRPGGGPVTVDVHFLDPHGGGRVHARHRDDAENPIDWRRVEEPPGCAFTWRETDHEYAVDVTLERSAAASTRKTVYIKVKPVESLPDRV